MKAISKTKLTALIRSDAQRFEALKREIVELNYFCKGTVLKRMMKCGNQQCPCHRDPTKRHGPYFECTYKVHNKTVNVKLYPEVTPLYRAAIQQHRRLKSLLGRMERLSRFHEKPPPCQADFSADLTGTPAADQRKAVVASLFPAFTLHRKVALWPAPHLGWSPTSGRRMLRRASS